jgi:hypothetical protein
MPGIIHGCVRLKNYGIDMGALSMVRPMVFMASNTILQSGRASPDGKLIGSSAETMKVNDDMLSVDSVPPPD